MKPSEAAAVLARAALYDRRTVGEIEAQAWAQALGDHALDDALTAVDQHYGESDKWIMPVHVNERARIIARARIGAQRKAERDAAIAAENNGESDLKAITSGGPAPEVWAEAQRQIALKRSERQQREAAEESARLARLSQRSEALDTDREARREKQEAGK